MEFLDSDKQHIWHPFSQHKNALHPIFIKQANGAYLYDERGSTYLDGISSWWVNLHGHGNTYIADKVYKQLTTLDHIVFDGFTHEPAIKLATYLLSELPSNFNRVFYSDNGSTANEVAIKMALQYWHNKGVKRTKMIAFKNAYHGDTFGSMSVGARNVFTQAFETLLFDVIPISVPTETGEISTKQLKETIGQYPNEIAAFIFEPLIQGAGGMNIYEASHLDKLIEICKDNDIITIADEVMTGFGRTGKYFASNYLEVKPDIICLSKGITGGVMPLGATVCSEEIFNAYLSEDKTKTFFHGHSYTANPVSCAAACASWELLQKEETWGAINRIAEQHLFFVLDLKKKYGTQIKCGSIGTIFRVEILTQEHTHYLNTIREKASAFFISKGILLRPLGNVLYIIPPYCITAQELTTIYNALEEFITVCV